MVVAAVGGGKGKDRRAYYFFKTASQNSQVAQHAGNDVSMSDRTYCTIKNLNWRGGGSIFVFKTASQNSQAAQHAGNDVSMSDRTCCTLICERSMVWRP